MPKKKTIFESAIRIVRRENFSEPKLEENKLKKMEKASGSVAAPKEDTERIFSGTPEEILDSLESTGDAYYHHSQLEPVITLLQSELAAAKESIKELIPLAETGQAYYRQNAGFDWVAEREKCKALLSRAKALLDKQ